jgi:hypothetical protein
MIGMSANAWSLIVFIHLAKLLIITCYLLIGHCYQYGRNVNRNCCKNYQNYKKEDKT